MAKPKPPSPEPAEPELHPVLALITRGWPALKKFLVHLAFLAAGSLIILFLYEKFIIPGKDSEIASLRQEKEKLNTDLQREDRENDKLRNENALYQSAHDEKNYPLKKRVQIIVKQINEFADAVEKGTVDINQRQNEWNNRFIPRINVLLKQLDEQGQHSEKLEQQEDFNRMMNQFPAYSREIASEIGKLADGLPEPAP